MRKLIVLVLFAAGCGARYEGAALAVVDWERLDALPRADGGVDCVRFSMTDLATITRDPMTFRELSLPLAPDAGLAGQLKIALAQPKGFGAAVRLGASLHVGSCDEEPVALDSQDYTFKDNELKTLRFLVRQPLVVDGGTDGGADAGVPDAGAPDAGAPDAGAPDAGPDAGAPDAGTPDAGTPDAGAPDASVPDAGPFDGGPTCPTAVVRALRTSGPIWRAADVFGDPSTIIAVGDNDAVTLMNGAGSGSATPWGGGTCTGNFRGVWVRGDGLAHAVTDQGAVVELRGAQTCQGIGNTANIPTSLTGYDLPDGGAHLFIGTRSQAGIVDNTSGTLVSRSAPGAAVVSAVDAWDSQTVYAAGQTTNGSKGIIWKWNPATSTWSNVAENGSGNTPFYAISVVTPNVAFAGGTGFFEWNGVVWQSRPAPAFTIYGLKAFSARSVYAVGQSGGGTSIAHWDGSAWSYPMRPMTGTTLNAVTGADGCHVFGVGDSFIVTNVQ